MQKQNAKRIVWIAMLPAILVFLSGGFVHAYYETSKITGHPQADSLAPCLGPNQPVVTMVVQDNREKRIPEKLFLPGAPSRLPFDEIKFTGRVIDFNRMALSGETALTNLLYANVKLSMLVKEYEALQDEVRRELSQHKIPYLDILPVDTVADQADFEDASFASRHNRIQRLYQSVLRNNGVTSQIRTLRHAHSHVSRPPVATLTMQNADTVDSLAALSAEENHHSNQRKERYDPLTSQTQSKNGNHEREKRADAVTPGDGSVGVTPWLVRLFLGFFEYFYNNKIEATIYLTILAFLLSLFLSSRSG